MSRTLKDVLNESNPNKVPNALGDLPAGSAFGLVPRFIRATVTANVLVLPEDARAAQILSAYGTAGSTGSKTVVGTATPAAGEVGVNAAGNILFGDAVTSAEVVYVPLEGEVVTESLPVVGSTAALVTGDYGALLFAATVDVGVAPGAVAVAARAASPATGQAALTAAGTGIAFNAAQVVAGKATVRYLKRPKLSVAQSLAQQVQY